MSVHVKSSHQLFSSELYLRQQKVGKGKVEQKQCDMIGRFSAHWATLQSLWQQLFCSNRFIFRQFL